MDSCSSKLSYIQIVVFLFHKEWPAVNPDYAGEICHAFHTLFKNYHQVRKLSLQYLLDWEEFLREVGRVPCISLQPSHTDQISSMPPHSGQIIDDYQVQAKKRPREGRKQWKDFQRVWNGKPLLFVLYSWKHYIHLFCWNYICVTPEYSAACLEEVEWFSTEPTECFF